MLRALRKQDGEIVEAWGERATSGRFTCPSCGEEVVLRQSKRRLDYFAHRPSVCVNGVGESAAHLQCKAELFLHLTKSNGVSKVQLERHLVDVRADVCAEIKGAPVAIEVQISNLSMAEISRRTVEYERRGIYVLWLAQWTPKLDSGRYTPKPWERWLHAAYFGRVYYWLEGTTIAPYHFEPAHVVVKGRRFIDKRGREKVSRSYSRRSVRWTRPLRGPTLDLLSDFRSRSRDWWKGGEIEVPPSKLYCDFHPHFWD